MDPLKPCSLIRTCTCIGHRLVFCVNCFSVQFVNNQKVRKNQDDGVGHEQLCYPGNVCNRPNSWRIYLLSAAELYIAGTLNYL